MWIRRWLRSFRPALVEVEARAGPAAGTVAKGGADLLIPSLVSVEGAVRGAAAAAPREDCEPPSAAKLLLFMATPPAEYG